MLIDHQVDLNLDDFFFDPPEGLFDDWFGESEPERVVVEVEPKDTRQININCDTSPPPLPPPASCSEDGGLSDRIREIEQLLMEDDNNNNNKGDEDDEEESSHNPLPPSPLVPVGGGGGGVIVDPPNSNEKSVDEELKDDDDGDNHVSKKQSRKLRNKDAALRSRERKKMYVKDLEMKSRYLESECRRLSRLLHTCFAENHMLRHTISLATKAESAVLLLESLLLVSLLWLLLDKVCLVPPPRAPEVQQQQQQNVNVRWSLKASPPKNKGGLRSDEVLSKSCRGSRIKMKISVPNLGVAASFG